MQAIELKEMRRDLRATLHFIDVHDVQATPGTRIISRSIHPTKCRAQDQTSDTAHAIYADTHVFQTARLRIIAATGP